MTDIHPWLPFVSIVLSIVAIILSAVALWTRLPEPPPPFYPRDPAWVVKGYQPRQGRAQGGPPHKGPGGKVHTGPGITRPPPLEGGDGSPVTKG